MKAERRKHTYAASDSKAVGEEARQRKLKHELKQHLAFIADYPLLSSRWLLLADSFRQVSLVACVELRSPGAKPEDPLAAEGKDDAGGTLWDQRREEMAVRMLLEEGKLNLAMRLLHKLCEAKRGADWGDQVLLAAKAASRTEEDIAAAVRHFEVGLGTLLALAYRHVEALQILDLPEMLTHVAEVAAEAAAAGPDARFEGTQPVVVAQYAAAVAQRLDQLDEDRVCDVMEHVGLVQALVRHVHTNYWRLSREAVQGAVLFLAYFAESETFCTEPERFVPDDDTKRMILDLLARAVDALMAERLVLRNNLHAIRDQTRRWERKLGKSEEPARAPGHGLYEAPAAAVTVADGEEDDAAQAGNGEPGV